MKVYLVSDIEGTCGYCNHEEGSVGTNLYDYFRQQMSREVSAACQGAIDSGAKYVLAHDAHGCAKNIIPSLLPRETFLMRQAKGDPFAMLSGIDDDDFDAVIFTGFHAGAGSNKSPVSHTFNLKTKEILLNGERLTELQYDVYSAWSLNIPTPFVSGDQAICEIAKKLIPSVTTVTAVKGAGAGSISPHPEVVVENIKESVKKAFSGDYKKCIAPLPKKFTLTINYNRHQDAYYNSFYPGVKQINDTTIEFTTDTWFEILRAIHYVLD